MAKPRSTEIAVCGECYKRFNYQDWARPAEALREHIESDCPRYALLSALAEGVCK